MQGWGAEFLATLMVTLITLSAYEAAHTSSRHAHDSSWPQTTPMFSPNAALPVIAAHVAAALFSVSLFFFQLTILCIVVLLVVVELVVVIALIIVVVVGCLGVH